MYVGKFWKQIKSWQYLLIIYVLLYLTKICNKNTLSLRKNNQKQDLF